ncbi:MAG: ribonuclease [Patescibacteria group bacterium]|nr:ribonuclease [Patescibacteria group bacterium]
MIEQKNGERRGKTGTIRITQKGIGFLRGDTKEGIEIPAGFLGLALNGDTVKVTITSKRKGGPEVGEVIEIVKRAKRGFAGKIIEEAGEYFLEASDARMPFNILIPKENRNNATPGDKVFVVIKKWTSRKKPPLGEVEKVLGRHGEHNAEMEGIILEKGFQSSFPASVEEEAKKIKEKGFADEVSKRRDMRNTTTFTIDPVDAKDFDDALSFKKLDDGKYEVGIHIADVAFFVRPGTALDKEALERATSVYLVDRTIPMLPEILSNDLCSLNPNEDKLAFSAIFELDEKGNVLKEWFGRTIINSDKRFSYEEAQEVLNKGEGIFFEELDILNKMAKELTKERIKAGALLMEQDEVKFKLDENGVPVDVYTKTRGDTNKMIEEFMLLANRRVATFGAFDGNKKERIFIYRIHEDPDKDKIKTVVAYLKLLGYDVPIQKGYVDPREFNKLFTKLEGKSEKETVQSVVIRSMQKAVYSTKNTTGHYGLAFRYYTHFTSPIRRYPDVIAHRMLDIYLSGNIIQKEKRGMYEDMAVHSSERERDAQEAERTSIKYKQVEYMSARIGQNFTGIVTGITEWGIYVAEEKSRAEGMIKLRDLTSDYYTYDEKKMMISSKKSNHMIRIGDKLNIKVKKADPEEGVIDYEFVS